MSLDLRAQLQTTLGDAYRLERELGGGGMSRVFVADETALGRKVVVKVVAPELLEGLSADRFTREVRVAARLQQANIVPLLSAGTTGGVPYYTMPFVDGLSLRTRLTTGSRITTSEATHILRDVAKALAYAHAQGVVHRDIKPENVLLSGGTAMVTDFGIAKALTASRTQDGTGDASGATSGTLTSVGSSIGTPAYMAPEQAVGLGRGSPRRPLCVGSDGVRAAHRRAPVRGQGHAAEAHRRAYRRNAGANRRQERHDSGAARRRR